MTRFRREISTAMKAASAPSRNVGAAACEITCDSWLTDGVSGYIGTRPSRPILIFSDDGFCCRRRAGRRRRDGEGDPGIPATGTILRGKLSVSLEVEIALHVADWKKESDLGTDANHLGLEAADTVAWTAVAT